MTKFPINIFSVWREYVVLAATIVASVVIMFLGNESNVIGGIKGTVIETLAILQRPINQLGRIPKLMYENQQLRQRNAELYLENSRLAEAFLENQRLRKMLDFDLYKEYKCIPAIVLGRAGYVSARSILINAGTEDGIRNDQAIVAPDGLVGKIIQANQHSSIGQILNDRNFRVGARVQRSRVEGIVKWAGDDRCLLSEVHKRADVKIGDVIITSGTSVLFPAGIEIGIVIDIHNENSSLFQDVYLEPSVNFNKLEQVFIIQDNETVANSTQ